MMCTNLRAQSPLDLTHATRVIGDSRVVAGGVINVPRTHTHPVRMKTLYTHWNPSRGMLLLGSVRRMWLQGAFPYTM